MNNQSWNNYIDDGLLKDLHLFFDDHPFIQRYQKEQFTTSELQKLFGKYPWLNVIFQLIQSGQFPLIADLDMTVFGDDLSEQKIFDEKEQSRFLCVSKTDLGDYYLLDKVSGRVYFACHDIKVVVYEEWFENINHFMFCMVTICAGFEDIISRIEVRERLKGMTDPAVNIELEQFDMVYIEPAENDNEVAYNDILTDLMGYLQTEYYDYKIVLPDSESTVGELDISFLEPMVCCGIKKALSYGFKTTETIFAFVSILFTVSPSFDQHPVIQSYLINKSVKLAARLEWIWDEIPDEIWAQAVEQYDPQAWCFK